MNRAEQIAFLSDIPGMTEAKKLALFQVEKRKAERLIKWFAEHSEEGDCHPGVRAWYWTIEKDISVAACKRMFELPDTRD